MDSWQLGTVLYSMLCGMVFNAAVFLLEVQYSTDLFFTHIGFVFAAQLPFDVSSPQGREALLTGGFVRSPKITQDPGMLLSPHQLSATTCDD